MKKKAMYGVAILIAAQLTMWPQTTQAQESFGAPTLITQEKVNCEIPSIRCDGVTAYFDIPSGSSGAQLYLKVGSQAVAVSPGQTGVAVSHLGFDRVYGAYVVYQVAEGCCWISKTGATTYFRTVSISGELVQPTPTPTPTPTATPATTVTSAPSTNTTETTTATTTINNSTDTSTATSSSASTSTNNTTDYSVLRSAFELVLANFAAFIAFIMQWRP